MATIENNRFLNYLHFKKERKNYITNNLYQIPEVIGAKDIE